MKNKPEGNKILKIPKDSKINLILKSDNIDCSLRIKANISNLTILHYNLKSIDKLEN